MAHMGQPRTPAHRLHHHGPIVDVYRGHPRSRSLTPRHSVLNQWDLVAPLNYSAAGSGSRPGPDVSRQTGGHPRAGISRPVGVLPENPLAVIHVSASTRFKRWPEESFVELVAALVRQDSSRRVFLTSGPSDAQAAHEIVGCTNAVGGQGERDLESSRWSCRNCMRSSQARLSSLEETAVRFTSLPPHRCPSLSCSAPRLRNGPARGGIRAGSPKSWSRDRCRAGPVTSERASRGDFRCLTSIGPERVIAAAERALRSTSQRGHITPDANERKIPLVPMRATRSASRRPIPRRGSTG